MVGNARSAPLGAAYPSELQMPVINHHARLYDEAIPRIYFYVTTKELREAQVQLDRLCPNLWSAKPVKDEASGAPEGDAKRYGFWIDPQIDSGLVADCLDSIGATPEPR
jgi:hypothetical protein